MITLFRRLNEWVDHRTGVRGLSHDALYEVVPGGSRWIYVTGSMLVFAFVTQSVTGIFLWMAYSPGSQNAWESVFYIQHNMQGGWLLRGVHHYMAQAMVVLMPFHLLQVVICKAYVPPREFNHWFGLVLMLIVLGLGLTGYLLPWDQKGYWATKVATELMSLPPGGAILQKLVVGGSEYGHFTLTRFFALHAGVLPALLVLCLAVHIALFRRHGLTAKSSESREDEYFWPGQVLKDGIACLLLLVAVILVAVFREAELGPPAEPTESYGAARPEWYFLFLFQLLKKFHSEFVGAIVVPTGIMVFLFAMPVLARIRYSHIMNVAVILVLIVGAGYLTYEAIDHDNYHVWHPDPPPPLPAGATEAEQQARSDKVTLWEERTVASKGFHVAKAVAEDESRRVADLVDYFGIPREGAAAGLIAFDPEIQGPRIFRRNCKSCHAYLDEDRHGIPGPERPKDWDGLAPYGAPNLHEFASRRRLTGLLDPQQVMTASYFGTCVIGLPDEDGDYKSGGMVEYVVDHLGEPDDDLRAAVVTLSAEAELVSQRQQDALARQDGTIETGIIAIQDTLGCTECHKFRDSGELGNGGPDLTGYFSTEWLTGFISDPNSERFYPDGNNDRMPAFAENPHDPSLNLLTPFEIEMLVRWLRGDDRLLGVGSSGWAHDDGPVRWLRGDDRLLGAAPSSAGVVANDEALMTNDEGTQNDQ
jgi:ubiquinol-cytochrome c reductase cytochrome b subunit